jgi:hypothetical protein
MTVMTTEKTTTPAKAKRIPTDKAKVRASWNDGVHAQDIADEHNISLGRVYQIIHEDPNKPVLPPGAALRKVDPKAVIDAVAAGAVMVDVGAAFGISSGRVSQIVQTHAPEVYAKLRAEREAKPLSRSAINRRAAKERADAGLPPLPTRQLLAAQTRKRPSNWKELTIAALAKHRFQKHAAEELGISANALRQRMKELGL